ncbi:hypothetical protein Tco_0851853 [Tanacetum coccineum]
MFNHRNSPQSEWPKDVRLPVIASHPNGLTKPVLVSTPDGNKSPSSLSSFRHLSTIRFFSLVLPDYGIALASALLRHDRTVVYIQQLTYQSHIATSVCYRNIQGSCSVMLDESICFAILKYQGMEGVLKGFQNNGVLYKSKSRVRVRCASFIADHISILPNQCESCELGAGVGVDESLDLSIYPLVLIDKICSNNEVHLISDCPHKTLKHLLDPLLNKS